MTIARFQFDMFEPRLTFLPRTKKDRRLRTTPELKEGQLKIDVELGSEGRLAADGYPFTGDLVIEIGTNEK